MPKQPKTFYRFRSFSATTLDSLCHDQLHFAQPGTFNDPLDCNPTLDCDSELKKLRDLLAFLIGRRVNAEVLALLNNAHMDGASATSHAHISAQLEAAKKMADIAYHSTNPDYELSAREAETWLLGLEIERELHCYYARGVCCFSTSFRNPLLWSHYGDQHKGLCIGYGVERNPKPQLQKVVYGGNRAIKTSTLFQAFIEEDGQAKAELDRDVLLRKARGWVYEREWRLIGEQGIQDSPLLLKEVTFGFRCTASVMHSVVRALSGREQVVEFYKIYEASDRFELRRRPLDLGTEFAGYLPRTAMSGAEMFGTNN